MRILICKNFRLALPIVILLASVLIAGNSGAAPPRQAPTPNPTPKPILLTDPVPDPKQQGVMWFPQTGHTLRGVFLDYWNRYGGLAQFGYPLTEEFFEPVGADNKLYQVQYFERNRFEYHPENKGTPYEVLLGVLGLDFRKADAAVPSLPPSSQPFYYFSETGHNLSGKLKQYWDTHGGLFVHGFPITEPVQEKSPTDGKTYTVQWFERSRLELHTENAGSPYDVLLGLLGTQLAQRKGYPSGAYPLWGYSPDFSWIAGEVVENNPFMNCHAESCGCVLFRYKQTNTNIQLELLDPHNLKQAYEGLGLTLSDLDIEAKPRFVVFGRMAPLDVPYALCRIDPNAPGYLVTQLQKNPTH